MMKVTLWGSRGSLPVSGSQFTHYGGNTSCVEIRDEDDVALILDAGTGIRKLGRSLPDSTRKVNLLLTHLHMDHIQGMGFFPPFFDPEIEVSVYGPASTTNSLRERLTRYLSPPLFPVSLRDLPCKLSLHEVPSDDFTIGKFKISCDLVGHVGPTVGYRIEHTNSVICYLPDHEPALGTDHFPQSKDWTSGINLAANADLLIHDSQWNNEEYSNRVGWGHSSLFHTFKFAKLARVKQLVTFHHDPEHSDHQLNSLLNEVIKSENPGFIVTPGTEGAVIQVN